MKVVFIAISKSEVEWASSLHGELLRRSNWDFLAIDTGVLCCDDEAGLLEEELSKAGILHTPLLGYKTRDMVKVLRREKPDALVVTSDQEYIRRAFVYAANGLHIPVLLFDMSIASNNPNAIMSTKRTIYRLRRYFMNIMNKYLYLLATVLSLRWNPLRIIKMVLNDVWVAFTIYDNRGTYGCQRIVVAGSWEKKVLIERGVAPDKIVVTGNPAVMFSLGNGCKISSLRRDLGIGTDDKVILFLTSSQVEHGYWSEDMRKEFVNGVANAVSPLLVDSVWLVIKIHPVENLDYYKGLLKGKQAILCKDVVLADAINMSDVVLVSGYSTTVLDASVLGKPVILLNVFNEFEDIPYAEMGLAVEVHCLDALQSLIEELLYNQASREKSLSKARLFFDSNSEFIDGKATERIVDLIESMV